MTSIKELLKKTEEHIKGMMCLTMFEELVLTIGPVDGRHVIALVQTLTNMRMDLKGPQLLYIMTKKALGLRSRRARSNQLACGT